MKKIIISWLVASGLMITTAKRQTSFLEKKSTKIVSDISLQKTKNEDGYYLKYESFNSKTEVTKKIVKEVKSQKKLAKLSPKLNKNYFSNTPPLIRNLEKAIIKEEAILEQSWKDFEAYKMNEKSLVSYPKINYRTWNEYETKIKNHQAKIKSLKQELQKEHEKEDLAKYRHNRKLIRHYERANQYDKLYKVITEQEKLHLSLSQVRPMPKYQKRWLEQKAEIVWQKISKLAQKNKENSKLNNEWDQIQTKLTKLGSHPKQKPLDIFNVPKIAIINQRLTQARKDLLKASKENINYFETKIKLGQTQLKYLGAKSKKDQDLAKKDILEMQYWIKDFDLSKERSDYYNDFYKAQKLETRNTLRKKIIKVEKALTKHKKYKSDLNYLHHLNSLHNDENFVLHDIKIPNQPQTLVQSKEKTKVVKPMSALIYLNNLWDYNMNKASRLMVQEKTPKIETKLAKIETQNKKIRYYIKQIQHQKEIVDAWDARNKLAILNNQKQFTLKRLKIALKVLREDALKLKKII